MFLGSTREEHPLSRMLFLRYEAKAIRRMDRALASWRVVAPPLGLRTTVAILRDERRFTPSPSVS
jgi:hypothetical protein